MVLAAGEVGRQKPIRGSGDLYRLSASALLYRTHKPQRLDEPREQEKAKLTGEAGMKPLRGGGRVIGSGQRNVVTEVSWPGIAWEKEKER